MVDESVRLHLGCGVVYRPGYVNIDTGDGSVSDLRADAMDLPYPRNSVSLIEAHHLIEHFDHVHVLYLLAHWYRILKPGGNLIVETPDLERAFSEYRKADPKRKLTLLQWIYGVESGGMQHRTGFDLESLRDTLLRTGFIHPMSHLQQTHRYEDGIRVESRKPDEISLNDEFFAEFRTHLFKAMPQVHDSMELLPLEQFCISGVRDELKHGRDLPSILSSLAICNPEIALIFLECATDDEFRSTLEELRDEWRREWVRKVLLHLRDLSFHQRLFTLWGLSRKRPGRSGEDLVTFRKDKEALVRRLIGSSIGDPGILEKEFRYISTLPPARIQCFHPQVVQHQARTLLNRGIKEFSLSNHDTARQHFNSSAAHDPDNCLVHWNLARLDAVVSRDRSLVGSRYASALEIARMVGEKDAVRMIEQELKAVKKQGLAAISAEPVTEFTICE